MVLMLIVGLVQQDPEIVLERIGQEIRSDARIRAGTYRLEDPANSGAVRICGSDLTVDFAGATLRGSDPAARPDERKGIGLRIEGGKRVVVRNAKIYGYTFGIYAVNCEELTIEACDLSFGWAGHLQSSEAQERIGKDFLLLRNADAWRKYGAAIWLEKCRNVRVTGCSAHQGQNGLLLVDSSGCRIQENDFSVLSGWGVALWNSCDNLMIYNRADFCLRATWWPKYRGGADSAALVLANGSHRNWILANSLTHGGDGIFLTNRADIANPDDGPCDDNVFAFNDTSFAAANAIEATFSRRNVFVGNLCTYGNYGFWGGFSRENALVGNTFTDHDFDGIAIEHGEGSFISGNDIARNRRIGIHLWAVPQNDSEVRKNHPSRKYELSDNALVKNGEAAFDLRSTSEIRLNGSLIDQGSVVKSAAGGKRPSDLLTFERGLSALRAGNWPDVRKEFESILKRVACRIERSVEVSPPKEFRLYRETGRPYGLKFLRTGEWGPVVPK